MVKERAHIVLGALGVFFVTFLAFSPALRNDFVAWDDEIYVTRNPHVQQLTFSGVAGYFSSPYFSSYTPLTLLSHALDVQVWGFNPRGHHLTSVVLHSLNAAWVFLLIVALGGRRGQFSPAPLLFGAMAGALLYALHPLRVEAAVCVSARKDLLSGFFLLPSVLAWVLYAGEETGAASRRWYILSLSLFLCATLAKASTLFMPVMLIVLDFTLLRDRTQGKRWRPLIVEKMPFFIVSVTIGLIAIAVAPRGVPNPYLAGLNTEEKFLAPLFNLSFYLWKTFWPVGLGVIYEYPRGWVLVAGAVGVLIASLIASLLALRRGTSLPLTALIWYVLFLIPVAGFLPSETQPLADRFSYLPAVGVFAVAGIGLASLWDSSGQTIRRASAALLVVLLLAECSLSIMQTATWRDRLSMWSNALRTAPGLGTTHYNYGLALQMNGDLDGAERAYGRALELKPDYADAAVNNGNVLRTRGNGPEARRWYERALVINPQHELALYNLALMDLARDSVGRAGRTADLLLKADSLNFNGLLIRGQILFRGGRNVDARAAFNKALSVDPSNGGVWYVVATLALQSGEEEEGRRAMARAARLGIVEAREYLAARGMGW